MEKLVIRKRKEIACFKVMADAVCPNTEIEIDDGRAALLIAIGAAEIVKPVAEPEEEPEEKPKRTTKGKA